MYGSAIADPHLVACPDCDLLQRLPDLESGGSARCSRCDCELWRRRDDTLDRCLALAIAGAILWLVANAVPMLGLSAVGHRASTTVVDGARQLWHDGQQVVAVLVLFAAVLAPALQIGLMLLITLGARRSPAPRWVGSLLRHHPTTRIWSMIEVMMVGVLVALIKIADYATVIPGIAMYALGALVVVLAAMQAGFDPRVVWARVRWAEETARAAVPAGGHEAGATP